MGLIDTGKSGYNSVAEFQRRVKPALDGDPVLAPRDLNPYPADEPAVRFLREHVRGSVLDVGCGFGRMSQHVVPPADHYMGVDPVGDKIDYAAKRYGVPGKVSFHFAPLGVYQSLESFDVIFFVTVLQHLTYPETLAHLIHARSMLKPGGSILLFEGRFFESTREECEAMYAQPDYSPHMIPKPIKDLCAEAGLRYTSQGGCRYILEPA